MVLQMPAELERRVAEVAHATGREPDDVAAEILDAGVERYNAKLAKLRTELQRADGNPDAEPGAFNRARARLGLPLR